jgi:hypothetical protein
MVYWIMLYEHRWENLAHKRQTRGAEQDYFRTEEPTKTLDEWELNAISEF